MNALFPLRALNKMKNETQFRVCRGMDVTSNKSYFGIIVHFDPVLSEDSELEYFVFALNKTDVESVYFGRSTDGWMCTLDSTNGAMDICHLLLDQRGIHGGYSIFDGTNGYYLCSESLHWLFVLIIIAIPWLIVGNSNHPSQIRSYSVIFICLLSFVLTVTCPQEKGNSLIRFIPLPLCMSSWVWFLVICPHS